MDESQWLMVCLEPVIQLLSLLILLNIAYPFLGEHRRRPRNGRSDVQTSP